MRQHKLSLINRKAVKALEEQITTEMAKVSAAWGSPVTWCSVMDEHCKAIADRSGEDAIATEISTQIAHIQRFAEFFTELKKDPAYVASFTPLFTSAQIGIKLVNDSDTYWLIESGSLFMRVQISYIGSYLNYYNVERLEPLLVSTERPFGIEVVKNLNAALPAIAKSMEAASKAFGRTLTWTDNYNELCKLIAKGTAADFGDQLQKYPATLAEVLTEFCKDADNLEALQEALSANTVTLRLTEDKYFSIENGVLYMDISPSYWGSYLNYFNAASLEKLL